MSDDVAESTSSALSVAPYLTVQSTMPKGKSRRDPSSDDEESEQSRIDDIASSAELELPFLEYDEEDSWSSNRKGKGKETSHTTPVLPPLHFSPTELIPQAQDWPSPVLTGAGPSSLSSTYIGSPPSPPAFFSNIASPETLRGPSRRGSLNSLNSARSTRSLAARSVNSLKSKFRSSSNNLANRLLRRRTFDNLNVFSGETCQTAVRHGYFTEQGLPHTIRSARHAQETQAHIEPTLQPLQILPRGISIPAAAAEELRRISKVRSYSSPVPLSWVRTDKSILSYTDLVVCKRDQPINLFDERLPRELRLSVFLSLVDLHSFQLEDAERKEEWTASRAASSQYVGLLGGVRELVKCSRVSKTWQSLVFDGQVWSHLHLSDLPRLPSVVLLRITRIAGPFVRSLDLQNHSRITASSLTDLVSSLCLKPSFAPEGFATQLTDVNLRGCVSLTPRSLHELIVRSPQLMRLDLRGLSAVTNSVCEDLALSCSLLKALNVGRCQNLDASALRILATRGNCRCLRELRASALRRVTTETLFVMGEAFPDLEILDLSGSRELTNTAVAALVCAPLDYTLSNVVELTARQVGLDAADTTKYYRRVTSLRHLSLSGCSLLSDIACSQLAFTMPRLEVLELAGIGAGLRDDGLVRLIETLPQLHRLDLEDASSITDAVVQALTPQERRPDEADSVLVGQMLEHLVLSYATNITNDAVLHLIAACSSLRVLEVDNTRISGQVIKEFVRITHERSLKGSTVVAIDCRGIPEGLVRELGPQIRPRDGWRRWQARRLAYVDARDSDLFPAGINAQDECDDSRIVLKSFASWQLVDTVRAAREKLRKARRALTPSDGSESSDDYFSTHRFSRNRWWASTTRRSSGWNTPSGEHNEGCVIM